MFKKKIFWIVLIVVLILTSGGYYYYANFMQAKTRVQRTGTLQTAVARVSDLTVSASASGKIVPVSQVNLGFDQSGTLSDLFVKVGDKVKKGQLLARLKTNDTAESVAASLTAAKLNVAKAQQSRDALFAKAELNRATAMQTIVTNAKAVRDAQYILDTYTVPANQTNMTPMQGFDTMKKKLDAARATFEPYKFLGGQFNDKDKRSTLLDLLYTAQDEYNSAVTRLGYEYNVQVAQANLDTARQDYDKLKDGPNPNDIAVVEADLANAKAQLDVAEQTKAVLDLIAPMDGTILSISGDVVQSVNSTPAMVLADLSKYQLDTYLDETDMSKVAVGQETEVAFDAIPNKKFKGHVIKVDPSLTVSSGVSTVRAQVELDPTSMTGNEVIPVGANAAVDVISGKVTGAVLIP
ncbi:MAG: efflux RND transporter periplasmic adaptor subunit, partial [Chloroflexota bacterium]